MTIAVQELREALVEALGEGARVSDGDSERDLHAADITFHRPQRPDLVVYPSSTDEVSRVMAIASERRVPVTPFGAGSSLEGHVIPTRGGISLDLSRMNRILEIAPGDLSATVQAGVTRTALERAAGEHGLFFPVDPGADATLGGMAATNAAGTTTIRYGKMRANVLALEAVLADGTIVRTGSRARKTSAGYDLTSLLVGSEGTLAVITEVRVRLYGIPEHVVAQRISFPTVEAACRTAAAAVAAGSAVTRLELLDAWTLAAINTYRGSDYPEGPCLLVEAAGTEATVEADLVLVRELAEAEGATEIVDERDPTGRARLWAARHDAAYAMASVSPGGTSARPTRAFPSPSCPARLRSPAPRSSASASTPPSSATPATGTSTSASSSIRTMRPRRRSPTSSSSGWSSTRWPAAAPARASTASAWARSRRSSSSTATSCR